MARVVNRSAVTIFGTKAREGTSHAPDIWPIAPDEDPDHLTAHSRDSCPADLLDLAGHSCPGR